MRFMFLFLLVLSVAAAVETDLRIFEQRSLGVEYYEEFDDVRITMDCDENIITIYILSEGKPVTGAVARLIYVDYSVPLLAAGPTDVGGRFTYKLVGERDFMTGLFLVVIEKEGYKNKEAHFDIHRCITEVEKVTEEEIEEIEEEIPEIPPTPPLPPPGEEPPEEIPPEEPVEIVENITENVSVNITIDVEAEEEAPSSVCPSFFLLLFPFCAYLQKVYRFHL